MPRGLWDRYGDRVRREFRERFEVAGRMQVNAVRLLLSEGYPPASAPGEPPHVRTGEYRRSWTTRQEERPGELQQITGTNKEYGPPLEYGAPTIGLEARPHARPMAEQTREPIRRLLSRPLPPNLV